MKRLPLFFCALLVSCGLTLSNPTLLQDGDLAIKALTLLEQDAKLLGAPAIDTGAIGLATVSVQTALADLKKGIKTPQDFATVVNDQVSLLAPTLLADFKANNTITTGVVLLQQLVLVIAAEVTANQAPPTARSVDVRAQLQAWMSRHK